MLELRAREVREAELEEEEEEREERPSIRRRVSRLPSVSRMGSLRAREMPAELLGDGRHPHSYLYRALNGKKVQWFTRVLAVVITANVFADVMITVPTIEAKYSSQFDVFEAVSSIFFIVEFMTRFAVAGERPKYAGWVGRARFLASAASLIDIVSFAPWLVEKIIWLSGWGYNLPATGFVRVFRMLRILKTERMVGSVDAIFRVAKMNSGILVVGAMMVLMLLLLTSSLLFYANRGSGDEQFESIPAAMYLSVLMLTGQGDPDGELTELTKFLCAFTALFSVAMVAIPASMLTFGFEIEATRIAKKRREARLRRRARIEFKDPDILSTSDSESDDARVVRKHQRRIRRAEALRHNAARRLRKSILSRGAVAKRFCCGCCGRVEHRRGLLQGSHDADRYMSTGDLVVPPMVFAEELDSSEDEYEELVLGKPADEAYEEIKEELRQKRASARSPSPPRRGSGRDLEAGSSTATPLDDDDDDDNSRPQTNTASWLLGGSASS